MLKPIRPLLRGQAFLVGPILLAGHVDGFKTGRAIAATNLSTGALHASMLKYFGVDAPSYGNPAGGPIAGF